MNSKWERDEGYHQWHQETIIIIISRGPSPGRYPIDKRHKTILPKVDSRSFLAVMKMRIVVDRNTTVAVRTESASVFEFIRRKIGWQLTDEVQNFVGFFLTVAHHQLPLGFFIIVGEIEAVSRVCIILAVDFQVS
jgi:hypothetical protein